MFTSQIGDYRRCILWKEEAIIGLKNAVRRKGSS
jgi:hypothetical protein